MPPVNNLTEPEFIKLAAELFSQWPRPHSLFDGSQNEVYAQEVTKLLNGHDWLELADPSFFVRGQQLNSSALPNIDLGNIFEAIGTEAFLYYLPGFLLHFLQAGVYEGSVLGGSFYVNFARRLQETVGEGPQGILGRSLLQSWSTLQLGFCIELIQRLYDQYGDDYEKFVGLGYEYENISRFSMGLAMIMWQSMRS